MFAFARSIVRHKVGAVAVLALGVFFLAPGDDDSEEKSNSPWGQDALTQVAEAEESGFLGGAIDSAIDGAVEYLDEAGLNPVDMADDSTSNWDGAADAFENANNR